MSKSHHCLLISILLISTLVQYIQCRDKPDMIVILSRHGAREPLNPYYDHSWENPSYLMNTGIEQHYALGNILARQYSDILKDISPQEIYLQSTYTSRAQMSVSAELLGLFHERSHKHLPNTTKRDFILPYANKTLLNEVVDGIIQNSAMVPNRLQFLMQKVHSNREENLLQITPENCGYIKKGQVSRTNNEVNRAMEENLKEAMQKIRDLGYDVKDIGQMKEFGDTLASRYSDNKPSLDGIPYDSQTYKDAVFGFQWWNLYNLLGTEMERSLRVFPLYSQLIDWFNTKAQGTNPLKVVLLGGHESSMFPFLSLYNITNHTCFAENYEKQNAGKPLPFPDCRFPEVASQLIWEFYNDSEAPYIRLLYNGKPFRICSGSQGVECTLQQFIKELPERANNLTKQSFDEFCSAQVINQSTDEILLTLTLGFFGIVVGLIIYLFLSKRMVLSHQYAKGVAPEDATIDIEPSEVHEES